METPLLPAKDGLWRPLNEGLMLPLTSVDLILYDKSSPSGSEAINVISIGTSFNLFPVGILRFVMAGRLFPTEALDAVRFVVPVADWPSAPVIVTLKT